MNLAIKDRGFLDFAVEEILLLKKQSQKGVLLLILGELEIMGLVAYFAGDSESFFALR